MKEFADDSFKFADNGTGRKILWEKETLLVMSNFSFPYSVFKRLVLQTGNSQGLFEKGLNREESPNIAR